MLRQSKHCSLIDESKSESGSYRRSIDEVLRLIENVDEIDDQLVPNNDKTKNLKRVNKSLESVFERNTDSHSNKKTKRETSDNALSSVSDCNASKSRRTDTKFVFSVVWGKYKPNKKHKEWNGDGFVVIDKTDKSIKFCDISGKSMGSSRVVKSIDDYTEGKRLVIGDKELELMNEVSLQEFQNKSLFVKETDQ